MARSFDGLAESHASVERIHAAFGREDYWLARIAGNAVTTTLDSLTIDADRTVTSRITLHFGRELLPGLVAKFVPSEFKMVQTEKWSPGADGQVHGHIGLVVSAGLGSCHAKAQIAPADGGSQMRFSGKVVVKIPLVGGNLEKSIGTNLAENVPEVLRFTTLWIDENA